MPGEAYELSLSKLADRRRELRQPISESQDLMLQYLQHLSKANKEPLTSHFTADVSYVKPKFFTSPYSVFPEGLHLGESREIGSIYIENYTSVAQLQIVFGPNTSQGPSNYLIVNQQTWRRYPLPKGITSVSILSNADDEGTVIVVLTTDIWAPDMGTLV